jgi:post-segregation antitoxin (ccd killing protein)
MKARKSQIRANKAMLPIRERMTGLIQVRVMQSDIDALKKMNVNVSELVRRAIKSAIETK